MSDFTVFNDSASDVAADEAFRAFMLLVDASAQDDLLDSANGSQKPTSAINEPTTPPPHAPTTPPPHEQQQEETLPQELENADKIKQKGGKKPNVPLLPRQEYTASNRQWKDRPAYDLAKEAYQNEWSARPEATKARPLTHAQQIRLKFFGHTSKKEGVPDPKPRCRSCRIGGNVMPPPEAAPDGTEARPLAPCGCDFAAACLEYYYELLGIYDIAAKKGEQLGATRKLVPKTSGASAFEMLLRWELDQGEPWSMKTMISASGERAAAARRTAAMRQENNWLLCPDFEPEPRPPTPKKPRTPRKKRTFDDMEQGGNIDKAAQNLGIDDKDGGNGGGGKDNVAPDNGDKMEII